MSSSSIRAVVVDPNAPGHLSLAEVAPPEPAPSETVVRVDAISLNLGEIRRIASAEAGWRPGWDIAGTVEQKAADGTGPDAGARVVGMVNSGAWAEMVAVPSPNLAILPESVTFARAATLPVAGLTALRALERGGLLLGQTVLVTGASGGVGQFALQLARDAGARVIGMVHRREREDAARQAGAAEVVVADDLDAARRFGPYHLVLESVGGKDFAGIFAMLDRDGTCVLYGTSAGPELTFDGRAFYSAGGRSLYGFILFYELSKNPAGADLERLARMIADGRLRVHIDVEAPWSEIGQMAEKLANRQITGKAVVRIE